VVFCQQPAQNKLILYVSYFIPIRHQKQAIPSFRVSPVDIPLVESYGLNTPVRDMPINQDTKLCDSKVLIQCKAK
jgi:hypothetical protein